MGVCLYWIRGYGSTSPTERRRDYGEGPLRVNFKIFPKCPNTANRDSGLQEYQCSGPEVQVYGLTSTRRERVSTKRKAGQTPVRPERLGVYGKEEG